MPYAAWINQKGDRASYSKLFLTIVMGQKGSGLQPIITGDESWFVLYYLYDSV
jgi:hypothetical protein